MSSLSTELQGLLKGFDRSNEHVVITDKKGVILYANAGAEKHTGYSRKEMIGRKPGDLWGGHMSKEFYTEMWETLRDHKETFIGEMRNRRRDNTYYWQEVHIIPILDSRNEAEYFIGIELNVDEQMRREQLIQAAQDHVPEHIKIQWPLKWLFEKTSLSQKELSDLQRHYSSEKALDMLTDDLLAISNVLHAHRQPDSDFCIFGLLQQIINEIKESFPARHYHLDYHGSSLMIHENKKIVYQLLQRIIINAAQYTDANAGDILLVLLKTGSHCVVRCSDDGIGISLRDQKKMFEKFYRGHQAKTYHPDGSGLGLYLAKTIADVRGWSISCISEPKKGTCFEVRIPLNTTKKDLAGVA